MTDNTIWIRHKFNPRLAAPRETSAVDLVERACENEVCNPANLLAAKHNRLCEIVGHMLDHMLTAGAMSPSDLPAIIGSLGDWEITIQK